jgi:tetratricopeptide (TPR) repeat protein
MAARAVTGGAGNSPYVGNRPYLISDEYRFCGRSRESREVAALWRNSRLTILSGRSGAGMTSLLQAGVFPLLSAAGEDVLPVGRLSQGTAFPVAALPEHNPYTLALLAAWAPGEPRTRLSGFTLYDFLRRRQLRTEPGGYPAPLLASIDQAEDLFAGTGGTDRYRDPFLEELAEVLDELPHVHLLLCLRDDYAADLARYEGLLGTPAVTFTLGPLTEAAAAEAVRCPLPRGGRRFAPGAAEALVARLRAREATDDGGSEPVAPAGRGVEPALLQVLCAGFWAAVPANVAEITPEHVLRYGDADPMLDRFCDEAVAAVAADHGIPPGEVAAWLSRQFVTELATRGTAYEGVSHTGGMPNAVARAFRDRHLLTASRRAGSRWYELHDDCLIGPVRRGQGRLPETMTESALSPADYLRAAQLAMADKDTGLAMRHAAKAARTAVGEDLLVSAEAESLLGNVAHVSGQYAEAEAHYRTAAMLFEAQSDTQAVAGLLAAVGQTMLAQRRYGEAVDYLHAAVGRIPTDLTVQTELAWALWHAGQQRAAVDVLSGVLAIDGEAEVARSARGEILADLGDAESALRDLNRVRRHQQPSTRAARGLALATIGGPGAASSEIDAALSRAPGSGPVLLYAARVAALGHDLVGAAALARRAVNATDPEVPPHQRRQALGFIEVGS